MQSGRYFIAQTIKGRDTPILDFELALYGSWGSMWSSKTSSFVASQGNCSAGIQGRQKSVDTWFQWCKSWTGCLIGGEFLQADSNVPQGPKRYNPPVKSYGAADCASLCRKGLVCKVWTLRLEDNLCWLNTSWKAQGESPGYITGLPCYRRECQTIGPTTSHGLWTFPQALLKIITDHHTCLESSWCLHLSESNIDHE